MLRHTAIKIQLLGLFIVLFIAPHTVWSQSEDEILYATSDEDNQVYQIRVLDVVSGEITDIDHIGARGSDAGWSPDGRYIYIVDLAEDNSRFLKLIDLVNDTQQIVTDHLMPDNCSPSLYWSPGGQYLAYYTEQDSQPVLHVLDTDNNRTLTLPQQVDYHAYRHWSPDERYLNPVILPSGDQPYAALLWDLFTDQVIAILDYDGYETLAWSPDTTYLAYIPADSSREIAVLDIASNEVRRYSGDQIGVWSPDGRYLIHHILDENSLYETFILDTAEDQVLRLGSEGLAATHYGWSFDSRYIAYETQESTTHSLHVRDMTDGTVTTWISGTFYFQYMIWSSTRNVLAFTSSPDSPKGNATQFATIDIDSGEIQFFDVALPDIYLGSPLRWSPDGRHLAVWTREGVQIYDHQTGELNTVPGSPQYPAFPRWSPDGRYLSDQAYPDIYVIDTADDLRLRNITNTPEQNDEFIGWRGTGQNRSLMYCGEG